MKLLADIGVFIICAVGVYTLFRRKRRPHDDWLDDYRKAQGMTTNGDG
jgi:hypothetical protein